MTNDEKLDFLAGQIHALIGFATAVITSHPNPGLLGRHLEKIGQVNLAKAGSTLISDDYLVGVHDMQDRLKLAVETALEHRIRSDNA